MAAVPELLEQQDEDRSKVRSSLLRYRKSEVPPASRGRLFLLPGSGGPRKRNLQDFKHLRDPELPSTHSLRPHYKCFPVGSLCTLIL